MKSPCVNSLTSLDVQNNIFSLLSNRMTIHFEDNKLLNYDLTN